MPTRTKRSSRAPSRSRSTASRGSSSSQSSQGMSYSDVIEGAREHPLATAAAAGAVGALAAGSLFLWSRRDQLSDQFSHLIQSFRNEEQPEAEPELAEAVTRRRGMSETGGGNASLGRRSGGGGVRSTASGRGRARAARTSAMS